jgi:hypothetical protein
MAALGRLAQPSALFGDLDLIEVIADTAAIDVTKIVDSLPGIGGIGIGRPGDRFDRERGKLSLSEAVKGRMELRGAVRRRAERIELDVEVTVVAVPTTAETS